MQNGLKYQKKRNLLLIYIQLLFLLYKSVSLQLQSAELTFVSIIFCFTMSHGNCCILSMIFFYKDNSNAVCKMCADWLLRDAINLENSKQAT